MKCARVAFLAMVSMLVHCEPADGLPPPQSPAAVDAPQAAAAADSAASPSDDDGRYASQEYAIGEDHDAYDDSDPSALTDFRGTLDPYGTWTDDATYGTVWVPSPSVAGADFRPYVTGGHWVYDDDWVWVSDYAWGWAPFHYGRWVWIEGRGWAWIPGRVYRGAWVVWSVDDGYGYVGWAPAPPIFLWWGGAAVAYGVYVGPRWVYCPRGEVFAPVVATHIAIGERAAAIAPHMRPVVAATPSVSGVAAGPHPSQIGYSPAQIPHATGSAATGLAHAQQFSRPSTAQPLGARPPASATTTMRSHTTTTTTTSTSPGVSAGMRAAPRAGTPPPAALPPHTRAPVTPAPARRSAPAPAPPAPRAVPRPGGTFRGGGGHHR